MGKKILKKTAFPIFVGISIFLLFSSSTLAQPGGSGQEAEKPRIPARFLREVAVTTQPSGPKVDLKADGVIVDFNSFKLDNPPRLVLDLPGISNASPRKNIIVGDPLLKDIRIGQHTDKVRVVLTFPGNKVLPHQITKDGQKLVVLVGQSKEENASAEKPLEARIQEPIRSPSLSAKAEPEKPKRYAGAKISLDLINADIREVFQLISNAAQREIISSDEVRGKITLRLIEFPWDHALDLILANRNLQKIEVGNVIRIIPSEKVLKEK